MFFRAEILITCSKPSRKLYIDQQKEKSLWLFSYFVYQRYKIGHAGHFFSMLGKHINEMGYHCTAKMMQVFSNTSDFVLKIIYKFLANSWPNFKSFLGFFCVFQQEWILYKMQIKTRFGTCSLTPPTWLGERFIKGLFTALWLIPCYLLFLWLYESILYI